MKIKTLEIEMETIDAEDMHSSDDEERDGLAESIHAPIETASYMKIDSRKEMLAMTKSRPLKRKLPITHAMNKASNASKTRLEKIDILPTITTTKKGIETPTPNNQSSRKAQ